MNILHKIKHRIREESETTCKTGRREKRIRSNENSTTQEENSKINTGI
jgi:hypothetical protein